MHLFRLFALNRVIERDAGFQLWMSNTMGVIQNPSSLYNLLRMENDPLLIEMTLKNS